MIRSWLSCKNVCYVIHWRVHQPKVRPRNWITFLSVFFLFIFFWSVFLVTFKWNNMKMKMEYYWIPAAQTRITQQSMFQEEKEQNDTKKRNETSIKTKNDEEEMTYMWKVNDIVSAALWFENNFFFIFLFLFSSIRFSCGQFYDCLTLYSIAIFELHISNACIPCLYCTQNLFVILSRFNKQISILRPKCRCRRWRIREKYRRKTKLTKIKIVLGYWKWFKFNAECILCYVSIFSMSFSNEFFIDFRDWISCVISYINQKIFFFFPKWGCSLATLKHSLMLPKLRMKRKKK